MYNKSGSHIEADNYKVVIDAIFESEEEPEEMQSKSSSDIGSEDETEEGEIVALKRLRIYREGHSSHLQMCSNGHTQALLVRPNEEPVELPEPLNGPGATVLPSAPDAINTMVESPTRQLKQKSSTTALIENNDTAKTEDVPLLEAPLEILCPDFNSIIASLNEKHGAIDKDCNLSSNWMKELSLFGICRLLKQLEKKRLDELDVTSLSPYYNFVQDVEKQNFNVKWLHKRLDDIRVAVVARNKAKSLKATKNKLLEERKQKARLHRWRQLQVKDVEDQLTVKNLEIEDLNGEINNQIAKFQHFETAPLLDGLI